MLRVIYEIVTPSNNILSDVTGFKLGQVRSQDLWAYRLT